MTKEEYTTKAKAVEMGSYSKEIQNALNTKNKGIGDWAEFYAQRIVEKIGAENGEVKNDEDYPEEWEELGKALRDLLNATSMSGVEEDMGGHATIEDLGGTNDWPATIDAAARIIRVSTRHQEKVRNDDNLFEKQEEAYKIMTERVRAEVEKLEAASAKKFNIATLTAAAGYINAKSVKDALEQEMIEARDEYNEAAIEFNETYQNIAGADEAADGDLAAYYEPDIESAKELGEKASVLEDAQYGWERAEKQAYDAEDVVDEAKEKFYKALAKDDASKNYTNQAEAAQDALEQSQELR